MKTITLTNSSGVSRSFYTLDKNAIGQIDTINVFRLNGFSGFENKLIINKSPGQVGVNIVGVDYIQRDLSVNLRLDFISHEKMRSISRELKQFLNLTPIEIRINDGLIDRKINAVIRKKPLIEDIRIRGRGHILISFIAPMPYFETSETDIIELINLIPELQINTLSQDTPGDFVNPELTQPNGIIFSSTADEIEYDNDSDAVLPIIVRFNGIATDPVLERSYVDSDGDTIIEKLSFNLSIAANEYVIINTELKTAILYSAVDDSIVNDNLNIFLEDRDYFKLVRGVNTLKFTVSVGTPTVTIKTNKRYEDAY